MTEVAKRLIDVQEYYKMAEVGILKPNDRVELINGEIIEMSPVGSKHASIVKRLGRMLNLMAKNSVTIGIQDPVRLGKNDEPEPDISVLKYRRDDYSESHPTSGDILILIEVSDSTYEYDKEKKSVLYAKNSIPEYWIFDVKRKRVEVYKESDGEEYLKKEVFDIEGQVEILNQQILIKDIIDG